MSEPALQIIKDRSVKERARSRGLAGCRSAGEGKNSCANNCADPKTGEINRTERPLHSPLFGLRFANQVIGAFCLKELRGHRFFDSLMHGTAGASLHCAVSAVKTFVSGEHLQPNDTAMARI
jgi:hypothetical protein